MKLQITWMHGVTKMENLARIGNTHASHYEGLREVRHNMAWQTGHGRMNTPQSQFQPGTGFFGTPECLDIVESVLAAVCGPGYAHRRESPEWLIVSDAHVQYVGLRCDDKTCKFCKAWSAE